MFTQVRFLNLAYTVSADGDTVFFEGTGDLIATQGGQPYNNVYVVKFQFRDRQIIHIAEYANPITFAQMAGLPIG